MRSIGPTRIVEIVGPAGAGKSTLSRLLVDSADALVADPKLRLRGVRQIPLFTRHAVALLPIFARERGRGRGYTWEEIKKLVYLRGWHSVFRRMGRGSGRVVIVDQGPVFELATLYGFGPERLRSDRFDDWWESMFRKWATSLDLLVCLDAVDDVLIPRIRSRDARHVVKGSSDAEARRFLSDYREAYRHVISQLSAKSELKILKFDSAVQSVEGIASRVVDALGL